MEFTKVTELSNNIQENITVGSEENEIILRAYSQVQNETNLFPINEIEDQRLWRIARHMWFLGRAYERLYAQDNSLTR